MKGIMFTTMRLNEKTKEETAKERRAKELTKLRRMMKSGPVDFMYIKKDGSDRKATGTLADNLIPETDSDDERKTRLSPDCFYYYDLKKEDWRCFIKDNFIKMIKK